MDNDPFIFILNGMKNEIHEIRKDVKLLLASKHKQDGIRYTVTAAVSAFVAITSTLLTIYFKH